ncbi:MAG: hypothetical protein R6U51_06060 [Anaerolineales bacterium]
MKKVLWVIQGILAVKLIATAVRHGFQHNLETMQEAIQSLAGAVTLLYVAAGLMFFGGAALVLPAFVDLPAGFTLTAAVGAAVLMLLSLVPHIIARDDPNIFVSVILFALAAFLAYGRWALVPLQ